MVGRRISHYLIEDRLGAGGMGEVYRALDLALGRPVALKLLRSDPAHSPEESAFRRARLVREARASARLQHPSIATFHEAGEEDGEVFLALEYVEGETLRARLARGPLAPAEAVSIAGSLLEALTHAHAAGLIHRDLKPENIMLTTTGGAKLLDFGLARPFDADGAEATRVQTLLTEEGVVLGTPGYLAPEQARGETADPASDVFALGVVLYEMLSGRPAFAGKNARERLEAVRGGDVVAPLPASIPPALAQVVARAMERTPGERYAGAGAFLQALRVLREGGLVERAASEREQAPSLAVLDFVNLSRDSDADWIGGGLGENLASELGQLEGVSLLPRARVARARAEVRLAGAGAADTEGEARSVGQRLGCRWTAAGAYERKGEALHVTVRVLDVATDEVIHAERVEAPVHTLFDLQERLAAGVRRALAQNLHPDAPRSEMAKFASWAGESAAPRGAPDLAAYEAHARGRQKWLRLEKGSLDEGRAYFEEAIRLDPMIAAAFAGLASIHAMRFTFRTDPAELESAMAYARRAIELDPALGEPHVWLCYALARLRRMDEALAESRRVMELDPTNGHGPYFGGCALLVLRRLDEAVALFQRTLELEPTFGFAWLALGWAHLESGRTDEAAWCFEQGRHLETHPVRTGPTTGIAAYAGEARRRQGRLAEARALAMEGLAAVERTDHMYRDTFRAFALATLGRTALDQRDPASARAAFTQLCSHVEGREHTLGGGHYLVQGLAGRAAAGEGEASFERALALFEARDAFDWSWMWGSNDVDTLPLLARAAHALGRKELATELDARVASATRIVPGASAARAGGR
ncbi:MAG: protein kinase [Candidatus Eisenbacteria bacterium]